MDVSYYEILQVTHNADPSVIEAAYQQLVAKYQGLAVNDLAAANHLQVIRQAYQTLRDPAMRAAYDRQQERHAPAPILTPLQTNPVALRRDRPRPIHTVPTVTPSRAKSKWQLWLAALIGLAVLILATTLCFSGAILAGVAENSALSGLTRAIFGIGSPGSKPAQAGTVKPTLAPTTPMPLPTLVTTSAAPVSFVTNLVMANSTEGDNFSPVDVTDKFTSNATLHAVVTLIDAPSGTQFRAAWFYEDVGGAAPFNSKLGEYSLISEGSRNLDFTLKPKSAWSVGTYRVEIYANDTFARSARFTIEEGENSGVGSQNSSSGKSYITATNLARTVTEDVFDPIDPTDLFTPDDRVIHLVIAIRDAPIDSSFKVSWQLGDQVIDSTSLTTGGTRNLNFTLTESNKPWPVGNYHADIFVNGRLDRTIYFTVK